MSEASLLGRTVAITSQRRRDEQRAFLERRGASVIDAPCVQTVAPEADARLDAALRDLVADPPTIVVIHTGGGIRRVLDTAASMGMEAPVRAALGAATVVARGAKSARAARECGVDVAWFGPRGRTEDVVGWLRRAAPNGRVVVQLDGHEDAARFLAPFAAVADVSPLPVYRWAVPDDPSAAEQLVDAACAGSVDAVLFTSSPAVRGLVEIARRHGRSAPLRQAFTDGVVAACIGEVCAATARSQGVRPGVVPGRPRLGSLLAATAEHLAADPAR